ncbi:mRNA triphosphatase CET1 [Plenodomus tracheiphilus IPT5]|uniref:mRNA-capping enzyme subunit beta n=1 Tax=Plenodomus tracheiphilus IPT5 TaxID=1408161 RepID=A0A6A7BNP8_9PLEO|nr:mRNA triphosphatase CET1 [Plenodomus tracheiphilus IPT5]
MDISALVNHDTEAAVLPRRSLSRPSSLSAPSPVTSAAKIPNAHKPTHKQMPLKRRRHDPKPIWAYREGEELPPELKQQQEQQRQQLRPPPAPAQPPPPPSQAQPRVQASPIAHRSGPPPSTYDGPPAPQSTTTTELVGFERPISDSPQVYDDVSRQVCEFLWREAIGNDAVRNAIADPHVKLEVEARWGQVIDRNSNHRLRGPWDSECVLKHGALDAKFESTMTLEQHKRMNLYLNEQIQRSKAPGATRVPINYEHTREIDAFYELGQQEFDLLNPIVRQIIHAHSQNSGRSRIRVTKKKETGEVKDVIIKQRLANLEISSPRTEWDYRIGINLEIDFLGPVEKLKPALEPGKTVESMQRQKDRISYAWLDAYQVDLTQVAQGTSKNHELELELDSKTLLNHADRARRNEPNKFESLITGMMNNLRVLSREMTPSAPGA